ncbi:hypothetical protein TTHERM_000649149 (macronuclear) [Tetrahymena thermophila SB210]|uniref:Uncharacterized protein n=1 Tax=Tetrahymena thermophila (strain SB210) TaxID=312017 RepID=W7XJS7_TETTS|nr:hypothetical protein TTHERM_000649149 [Tetrahymena thermophila SB210]EWS74294.1 hypothetical protein TTHERM_000649149 [Tetrahymena thermophila SB210]|eukprot:XP_012653182.1 hypothetical protein TTHERM_000649149 [Tetrahymena thermophila SB210]
MQVCLIQLQDQHSAQIQNIQICLLAIIISMELKLQIFLIQQACVQIQFIQSLILNKISQEFKELNNQEQVQLNAKALRPQKLNYYTMQLVIKDYLDQQTD